MHTQQYKELLSEFLLFFVIMFKLRYTTITMAIDKIITVLKESIRTKEEILNNPALLQTIDEATTACIKCLKADGKILFCGNGGSAADAQHLAAEFSGRFYHDREPLFAEALHVNTSYLTAVANDYSYEEVYARILKQRAVKVIFWLASLHRAILKTY